MTIQYPTTGAFDVLIIIPTLGKSEILLPSFERLLKHLGGYRTHIVASVNPKDQAQAEASISGMTYLWSRMKPDGCSFTIYRHPEPCGFGGAINRGIQAACGTPDPAGEMRFYDGFSAGLPEQGGMTVIWNDDLRVTEGWLAGMFRALEADHIRLLSEIPNKEGLRPRRSMADYGKVGMVGPVSNVAAGIQVIGQESAEDFRRLGVDKFTAQWREEHTFDGEGAVYATMFLSGFCQGFSTSFVEDCSFVADDRVCLFDERYLIAGFEDNDLATRADNLGYRAAVAYDTFIGHLGHKTFDAEFPEMQRGMLNRLVYYDVHRKPVQEQKLVAAFRVRLDVPNDVNYFRMAMASIGQFADGIAVLLTGPLSAMRSTPEWQEDQTTGALPGDAQILAGYGEAQEVRGLREWCKEWSRKLPNHRSAKVVVERYQGEFNERDERNYLLGMARGMEADWIISVDHDETIEPRVTRAYLDRLMKHPDPMVQSWDFSWVNHWANNRWQNITRPWGDGGAYTGGMHGYRLFRVNKAAPRRIMAGGNNGLHCGNIPMVGPLCKRTSGIRFRHFGYMRVQDRRRKLGRYNEQDPSPNPLLVGGTTYQHITHEENQLMSAFSPTDGIGLHMLCYEGESVLDVGRHLDNLYGCMDRIVMVWTGEWTDADRAQIYGKPALRHEQNMRRTLRPAVDLWEIDPADWPETGPSLDMAKMAEHFGVEWVQQPIDDNIAQARNAGIDALHGTPGLGWGYFVDPDEYGPQNAEIGLRRMAEVTDAWGWMFRFSNHYEDGRSNTSESVRMHRLDDRGVMRMNGRVHESFELATRQLVDDGYGSVIRIAPEVMHYINTGLQGEPDKIQDKLDRYKRLVEMELDDNPMSPGGWTTLGLYWSNEGYRMVAMECFARGMMVADRQFLPFQEAGLEYMRLARNCYAECEDRMGNHSNRHVAQAVVDFIDKAAPPMPIMGMPGRQTLTEAEAMRSLPAMPDEETHTVTLKGTLVLDPE